MTDAIARAIAGSGGLVVGDPVRNKASRMPQPPETAQPPLSSAKKTDSPASSRPARWATITILIGSLLLIFVNLGHYALWDDEAITAMTSRAVWRTHDTSAWVDSHNLLAYRNGLLLKGFADRYTPPLQFYLLAPVIGVFGESPLVCRLPFAIFGAITICLMLRWMWRAKPEPLVWWASIFIVLSNASFFLFQRQCRYYALATVLTMAAGYFYYCWNVARKSAWPLAIVLAILLSAQYLNYAAAVGCLAVDYIFWGRKRRSLDRRDLLALIIPQLIVGVAVFSIWNKVVHNTMEPPPAINITSGAASDGTTASPADMWIFGYFKVLWWNWRDMLASDFIILPLLLMCPLAYIKRRSNWLLRAPVALVVYLAVIALLTSRNVSGAGNAEIRYLAPVLPLCIGISIVAVWGFATMKRSLVAVVIAIAVLSTLIEPAPGGDQPVFGSTALSYIHELWKPQTEPYTPTIAWVKSHIAPNKSIYVQPDWMAYPLMFADGKPVYAWQLTDPPKPEFANLPDIHFQDRVAPDYLIAFGPFTKEMGQMRARMAARGITYEQIDTIHILWKDLYRPERIWRTFTSIDAKPGQEIYIYRRSDEK